MKTSKHAILLLLLFKTLFASGQQFWLTTNEFWGGPKTGITLINDSVFFVSTTNSVLRSTDEFHKLELVLIASEIYTLFATTKGKILAGGTGKIYISNDLGISWDSLALSTTYPLKQFVENSKGDLFAITGVIDEGDGVFFSEDGGLHWEKRNNGLGGYLGCDKIAIDKNNRIYLATSDEDITGLGGLYISDDNGFQWKKISVGIDSINTSVKIASTTNLSVLANESVYISFWGSGGNFGIELNIYKNTNEVDKNSLWKTLDIKHSTITGMDDAMNNIYVTRNGDWYSSISESFNKGGTCYSKDGKDWEVLDYGLGVDVNSRRNEQHFVETSNGQIYMIQYMDERVYKTDKSIVTNTPYPFEVNPDINIYPNPVRAGEYVKVKLEKYNETTEIAIYDISNKSLLYTRVFDDEINIPAPVNKGIYIVFIRNKNYEKAYKIVVN